MRLIRRIFAYTILTKLRSFQYRILCWGLVTNRDLKRYKIVQDDLCTFCMEHPETIVHLFCECDKVQPLWFFICKCLKLQMLSHEQILLNDVASNPKLISNCIVLLTKHFIYRTRCLKEKPLVSKLKSYILDYKQIEHCIAVNKNKLSQHLTKWENTSLDL